MSLKKQLMIRTSKASSHSLTAIIRINSARIPKPLLLGYAQLGFHNYKSRSRSRNKNKCKTLQLQLDYSISKLKLNVLPQLDWHLTFLLALIQVNLDLNRLSCVNLHTPALLFHWCWELGNERKRNWWRTEKPKVK